MNSTLSGDRRLRRNGARCAFGSLLTLAVLGLAACGSSEADNSSTSAPDADTPWEEVVAAAKEEGQLVVLSSEPPQLNEIYASRFMEEYPEIKVEMIRLGGGELAQRVEAESSAGRADSDAILFIDQKASATWAERNWTVPLLGPNVNSDKAAEFLLDDGHTINGGSLPIGFAWDPNSGIEPPTSPADLADPRFKGKLAMYSWYAPTAVSALAGHEAAYGEGFLASLAPNEPQFYDSSVPLAQDLAAGVVAASLVMNPASIIDLPVEIAYGEMPPAWLKVGAARVNSDNPNAAQVFLDWAMTTPGQEVWGHLAGSSYPGIEGTEFSASELTLLDASYYEPEFQAEWIEKFEETFGRQS